MYHIANDLRAKKSAELIVQGLYKSLETKPYKDVKIAIFMPILSFHAPLFYRLFDSIYDVIVGHKGSLKILYDVDDKDESYSKYFTYFLVAMIYTSFAIFYREKGKKSIEEVLESTNEMLGRIMETWAIGK